MPYPTPTPPKQMRPPQKDSPLKPKRPVTLRKRLTFWGVFLGLIVGFWLWQPYEYRLGPREELPTALPAIPISELEKIRRVLVVTAHPDDSEFYAGGTLSRLASMGIELHLLVLTDGDKGYYVFVDAAKNRRIRRAEQTTAARRWKAASIQFAGEADARLSVNRRTLGLVSDAIAKIKPDVILTFDPENPPRMSHRDHNRCGQIVMEVVQQMPDAPALALFGTQRPGLVMDITDFWDAKATLIADHASQFSGEKLDLIVNSRYEDAETIGALAKVDLGEGFRYIR